MDYSQHKQVEFRRKFWKILGAEISMTDPTGTQLLGYIKMKAFKLREDIRLYHDQTMQQEVFRIAARQIIDFGATYDIFDSATNQQLFSLRRKGLKSTFVRDHWLILDSAGKQIGDIVETSSSLAIVRRWLSAFNEIAGLVFAFVPETYDLTLTGKDGQPVLVGQVVHRKNPFIVKMGLDTSMAPADTDPRIPIASVALLSIMDASKNS